MYLTDDAVACFANDVMDQDAETRERLYVRAGVRLRICYPQGNSVESKMDQPMTH